MRNHNQGFSLLNGCLLVLILLSLAISVSAQVTSTGTILGMAKDSSGASVPGATITITNVDTNATRTIVTGDDGAYRVPALPVGHYQVKAEHPGFKTETRAGIILEVAQEAVVNLDFQVGTAEQQVLVTGEAEIVNTQDATLGGIVNEQKMQDLPLNGRNYVDLSLLQPGVSADNHHGTTGGAVGTSFSANGAPVRSNNFTLDGAILQTQNGRNPTSLAGTTLGVDGIREYKIITSNFPAQYGLTMGSQMVIVSKGGTNQFHGDAFEYVRNAALDARNFFDYGYQQPGGRRLPGFQRNNFGGSFGGPIRKDKTFFYGVYEELKQNLGVTNNTSVPGVPGTTDCHGTAGTVLIGGTGPGQCPDVGAGNTATISSYMAPFLALLPTPTQAGVGNGLAHYQFGSASHLTENYGQMRVDQNFSQSDMFFARYTIDNGVFNNATTGLAAVNSGNNFPQFGLTGTSRNQWLSLSEDHIFSPSLLNSARFSFSRTVWHAADSRTGLPNSDLGPPIIAGHPIGRLSIGGINGGSYTTLGGAGDNPPVFGVQNIYTLSDDLSLTRGKHAFRFGVLFNRWNEGIQQSSSVDGFLTYPNFAQFVQSQPSLVEFATPGSNENRFYTFNTIGLYGQDDWRATSRLTVNLGLRYEFLTVPNEINGRQSRVLNPYTDPFTVGPIMANHTLHDFSPRVGLAYDLFGNGKTALRAGFGMYYDVGNFGSSLQQDAIGTPPFSGLTDIYYANPTIVQLPLTTAILNTNSSGITPQFIDYNVKSPYMLQYNASVEQQLPWNMGLSVAFVGNHGVHLFTITDSNPVLPTSTGPCGNPGSLCVNGVVPFWDTGSPKYVNVNPNMPSTIFLTTGAESQYRALQVLLNKRVSSGLELAASYTRSQTMDDTQGQANVSDCNIAAGLQGVYPENLRAADWGPACFNIPNNWVITALYHFPKISSDRGFLSKAVNGWWMSSIVAIQSGQPFSVVTALNRSNSGVLQGQNDRVNLNTAAFLAANPCTSQPGQTPAGINPCAYTPQVYDAKTVITGNINQWFNPAMFSIAPATLSPTSEQGGAACPCTISQLGSSGRNILTGPPTRNWDFSMVKDTKLGFLGESGMLQFRAEVFNILNHTNFAEPSSIAFTGAPTHLTPFSESVKKGTGQITAQQGLPRQIQLALKILF